MIIDVILNSDLQLSKKVYCMYSNCHAQANTQKRKSRGIHEAHMHKYTYTCINILTHIYLEGGGGGIS